MDAARYDQGLTYEQFKARMTQNRDRMEANEATVALDERDIDFFRSLRPIHVVALVEEWCGDVVQNLPVVAKLAEAVGDTMAFRCFDKPDHPDLATRFLNRGRYESIPVFAIYDETWREVGVVVERPTSVTERREEDRLAIHAEHPEFGPPDGPAGALDDETRAALLAEVQARRAATRAWSDRQLVLALRDAAARAPQPGERVVHRRG